ncbi:MAG: tetratricopeptide repeat protein, partial [Caulobacteraceae bacterium]
PMPFDRIQCADMAGWSGDLGTPGWKKVAASLAELIAGEPGPAAATAPAKEARRHSICVFPFSNISDDPQQEYFSDGISEDIITDLSKVSALSVVSRNSAFLYKGKHVDLPKVARELGVEHVLEGSVRKAGNRVRITAQLIDASRNDHVWADRWDRDLTDIFALQDEISQAIVAALKLKLLPEEKKAIERRGTENADAYNLFLMARQQFVSGNKGDPRREETVIRLCQRAIEIDPNYARAWALLALGQHTLRFERGRAGDDGLGAAEKAISLDPTLAEPHAVKARNLRSRGRREEADAELALALSLGPDDYEVIAAAAQVAYEDLRLEEAERLYSRISAVDETDFSVPALLVSVRHALGDAEGAKEAARTCIARVEKVLAQHPNNGAAMAFGVGALAVLGEAARARDWISRALLIDPDNTLMRYNFACSLASFLGDADGALSLLGPIFAEITPGLLVGVQTDPDLASIRDDPRFQAMLAEAEKRLSSV